MTMNAMPVVGAKHSLVSDTVFHSVQKTIRRFLFETITHFKHEFLYSKLGLKIKEQNIINAKCISLYAKLKSICILHN